MNRGENSFTRVPASRPSPSLQNLLRTAALASDAFLAGSEPDGPWHVNGNPTEGAVVVAAAKAGIKKIELDAEFPRIGEIPFTSETKRMTTLHSGPQGAIACAKGALRGDPGIVCLAGDGRGKKPSGPRLSSGDSGHGPRPGERGPACAGGGRKIGYQPRRCPAGDDLSWLGRNDRPAPPGGQGRNSDVRTRRNQAGNDHRRSSANRTGRGPN